MFIIKKAQFEAFRVPLRKAKRDNIFLSLQTIEGNKVSEEKNKIIVEDKKGRTTSLNYSEKNLLNAFTKPSGLQYRFDYDEEDRISKVVFPGDESLELTFSNHVPVSIALNSAKFQLKYDEKSRLSEIVYPDQKGVLFQYNESSRISSIINRVNAVYGYETKIENNRLTYKTKDPLKRETIFMMDSSGGIEKIKFPDNSTHEVKYDEELDAEIVKLRNGTNRTTYFDGLYPYRREWDDDNYQELKIKDGLIEALENTSGTILYKYDDKQRLLTESFQQSTVEYVYEDENLKKIIYPSGLITVYEYDEDDRLKGLIIGNETCNYLYATNGTLEEIRYPNGLRESQVNKVLGGLHEKQITSKTGELLFSQICQYDILSRLTTINQQSQASKPKNLTFEYDNESRLTAAIENVTARRESFQYDMKGNFIKVNNETVRVGVMDQITSIGGNNVLYDKGGNATAFFDDEGNQLQLTYADDSTLRFAKIKNETWEYWYDGLGRRIGKSNGKETFVFFWSGDKLISEEYRFAGKSTLREYIYTDSNMPVAFNEQGKLYWLQQDIRGAVTGVYDNKGVLVWSAEYNAFGKATIVNATVRQPWRLAGQYHDEETGLHYNMARYYSPALRSFLSLDPQWYKYEATNYSYAANDPYNRIDTNGNLPEWTKNVASISVGVIAGTLTAMGIGAALVATGAVASVAAIGILGLIGIGAIAGAVSGIAESITNNLLHEKPVCRNCMLKAALIGAVTGAALVPVLKVLGSALAPVVSRILPKIGQRSQRIINILKGLLKPPRGAIRSAKFGSGWPKASLKDAINKFAPGAKGVKTSTGKTIYTNPNNGIEVVADDAGKYFRVRNPNIKRRGYLDLDGNVPNNKIVNGKQMGRTQAEYNQITHFNNSD